jgi:hypothetical protein
VEPAPKPKKKARRHQLEPISYDELLSNAGMSGFVSFLEIPAPVTRQTESHTEEILDTVQESHPVKTTTDELLDTVQESYIHYVGVRAGVVPRRERIYRARTSEDGHSFAEQAVYEALWRAAAPEGEAEYAPRTLRIGYDRLARLTRLSWVSVKANLRKLEVKLAIETIGGENSAAREGKAYRIYSSPAVLERRQRAGLVWVRRTRGVELLAGRDVPGVGS